MKIAVVGCLHGKLDRIYEEVKEKEKLQGFLIDLILVCGDFQAVRNVNDLKCMAVPDKYKELGDFHEYYKGKKHASHLTLVIGGNHEASNYFQTLPYGGWIAPNIYYMGYSNVLKMNGVRIAGVSGIFNRNSSNKGHHEFLPYNPQTIRTVYYTRYLEVFRMLQTKDKLDIMVTHDWPLHIYNMPGAKGYLLRKKPFFREDIENHKLGSPMYELLLNRLKPVHWFSAHLHVRFQTNYIHQMVSKSKQYSNQVSSNSNEDNKANVKSTIKDDNKMNDKSIVKEEVPKSESTHFLALDKCLFRRPYLEVVNVQSNEFNTDGLEYDLEWLSILKITDEYVSIQEHPSNLLPQPYRMMNYDLDTEKENIKKIFNDNFKVPNNFTISMPFNLSGEDLDPERSNNYTSEQTSKFCKLLNITDPMQKIVDKIEGKIDNPDKISISDGEEPDWKEESVAEPDQSNLDDVSVIEQDAHVESSSLNEQTSTNDQSSDKEQDDDQPSAKRIKEEPLFFIDKRGQI